MSTRWRCAVCESFNDGGDTCSACGASFAETASVPPPAPEPPARARPIDEIPVRQRPVREEREPEIAEYETYPVDSYSDPFGVFRSVDPYEGTESIDVRPRVRVYGCCLPIFLAIMFVIAVTMTGLAALLFQLL